MASSKTSAAGQLRSLAQVPIMIVVFTGMWASAMLGYVEQTFRFLGRGMQSPNLKAKAFKGYEPTERDVFVCTYSKSGTNWAMQIAYQIAHNGRGEYDHIHDVVPWPEAPLPTLVQLDDPATYQGATNGLRVIKTHLESNYLPYSSQAKYIVVARDPKEIFVSSYYFSAGMLPKSVMVKVEEWLKLFLSKDFPYGSWAAHMAGFWPWRDRENVLFLTYAEMKADPAGAVRRIADLMGIELSDAVLARVLEKSSFAHMKQLDHKFRPNAPFPFNRMLGQPSMIRSGNAGGASELLSAEQQAAIDAYMKNELREYGCDFPYAEMFEKSEVLQSREVGA